MKRNLILTIFLLSSSIAYGAVIDFTTWNHIDADTYIITATRVDSDTGEVRCNSTEYYGNDEGAGSIGEFEYFWYGDPLNYTVGATYLMWGVGDNATGNETAFDAGNDGIGVWANWFNTSPDELRVHLENYNDADSDYHYNINGYKYFVAERTAATTKLYIYSDGNRQFLKDTLSVTHNAATYRYIYVASMGGTDSSAGWCNIFVQNFDTDLDTLTVIGDSNAVLDSNLVAGD